MFSIMTAGVDRSNVIVKTSQNKQLISRYFAIPYFMFLFKVWGLHCLYDLTF